MNILNIWRIALKELKAGRDFKMIVMMVATPVLLTLILGTVLANAFNPSVAVGDIRVLYVNNSPEDNRMTKYWNSFVGQAAEAGITFEQVIGHTDAKLEVENNRYVGFVEVTGDGIDYYGNSRSSIESGIAQGMIASFADRYKLAAEVAVTDPEQADAFMSEGMNAGHVQAVSLDAARQPSSMDYYAVAMTTLIVMYAAMTAAQLIDTERKRNTASRLLAAPVRKGEIFAGLVAGNLLQNVIYILVVVLISKYMFNVYWGDNLGLVLLVLLTQIVFALSLGLGFGYMIKGKAAGSVVMMIIQVGAFFGGSYFPVEDMTGILRTMTNFSPLEWTNDAILQIIYADNGSAAASAMLLNLGFSVVLLGTAVILMRRREGL